MAGPYFLTGSGLYSDEAAADAGPLSGAPLPLVSGPGFTVDQYQQNWLRQQALGRTGQQVGVRQRPAYGTSGQPSRNPYGTPLTGRNPYGTPLASRYRQMAGMTEGGTTEEEEAGLPISGPNAARTGQLTRSGYRMGPFGPYGGRREPWQTVGRTTYGPGGSVEAYERL